MKKIIAILMSLMLLLGVCAVPALAEEHTLTATEYENMLKVFDMSMNQSSGKWFLEAISESFPEAVNKDEHGYYTVSVTREQIDEALQKKYPFAADGTFQYLLTTDIALWAVTPKDGVYSILLDIDGVADSGDDSGNSSFLYFSEPQYKGYVANSDGSYSVYFLGTGYNEISTEFSKNELKEIEDAYRASDYDAVVEYKGKTYYVEYFDGFCVYEKVARTRAGIVNLVDGKISLYRDDLYDVELPTAFDKIPESQKRLPTATEYNNMLMARDFVDYVPSEEMPENVLYYTIAELFPEAKVQTGLGEYDYHLEATEEQIIAAFHYQYPYIADDTMWNLHISELEHWLTEVENCYIDGRYHFYFAAYGDDGGPESRTITKGYTANDDGTYSFYYTREILNEDGSVESTSNLVYNYKLTNGKVDFISKERGATLPSAFDKEPEPDKLNLSLSEYKKLKESSEFVAYFICDEILFDSYIVDYSEKYYPESVKTDEEDDDITIATLSEEKLLKAISEIYPQAPKGFAEADDGILSSLRLYSSTYNSQTKEYIITHVAGGGIGGVTYMLYGVMENGNGTYTFVYSRYDVDLYLDTGKVEFNLSKPVYITLKPDDDTVVFDSWDYYGKINTDYVYYLAPTEEVTYDTPKGVEIEDNGNFEVGTVVTVKAVESGKEFEAAKNALADVAENIVVFDFTAIKDGAAVQPNGKVKVVFDLPEGLSAENLKMFYISKDGEKEEVPATVDKEKKTVTAELTHFSTYVLANVKATSGNTSESSGTTSETSSTNPPTGDSSNIVILFVLAVVSLAIALAVTTRRKAQASR